MYFTVLNYLMVNNVIKYLSELKTAFSVFLWSHLFCTVCTKISELCTNYAKNCKAGEELGMLGERFASYFLHGGDIFVLQSDACIDLKAYHDKFSQETGKELNNFL